MNTEKLKRQFMLGIFIDEFGLDKVLAVLEKENYNETCKRIDESVL